MTDNLVILNFFFFIILDLYDMANAVISTVKDCMQQCCQIPFISLPGHAYKTAGLLELKSILISGNILFFFLR